MVPQDEEKLPEPGTAACQASVLARLSHIDALKSDVQEIKDSVKQMKEIIEAWNNVRGFATTMGWIAKAIKITAVVGGTIGALWYLFKYGHLPPPTNGGE